MTTGTPVVVSRIQHRRGTKSQFLALYPSGYLGVGGYNDPAFPNYNQTNYPNVLQPGELALCTDTREMFMGNLNGEYFKLDTSEDYPQNDLVLSPYFVQLAPSAPLPADPWNLILNVDFMYLPTPFLNIMYDVTDSALEAPNALGSKFSKNGILRITMATDVVFGSNNVSLSDEGTEINAYTVTDTLLGEVPAEISFKAVYNSIDNKIQLYYQHNFPVDLTFHTSTIIWSPL